MTNRPIIDKSRWSVFLTCGLILPAAFIYSATADVPHVLFICVVGMIVSLIVSKPIVYSDRSVIYTVVAALILAILLDLLFPVDRNRFNILGSILRANITAPLLLYLAIFATFFESTPYVPGMAACFSLVVMMIGGETVHGLLANKRFPIMEVFFTHSYRFFGVLVAIQLFFILLVLGSVWRTKKARFGKKAQKVLLVGAAMLILVVITYSGIHVFYHNETRLREIEAFFLRWGMRKLAINRNIIFRNEVNLNQTLSPDVLKNADQIVLRAQADSPPGYLRGRVYDTYDKGHWTRSERKNIKLAKKGHEGILAYSTFSLPTERKAPTTPINIFLSNRLYSDVLLYDGSTHDWDLVADNLSCNEYGELEPKDWERDGGYTTHVPRSHAFNAFPLPQTARSPSAAHSGFSDDFGKVLRSVPDDVGNKLDAIIEPVLKIDSTKAKLGDSEIIRKLTTFFNREFTYSLDVPPFPEGTDPVIHFLTTMKKGHCELFATAMTLALRRYGIPARYVTGFVCQERHPLGGYYLSRVADAHAWVEAYPKDRDAWVLVEPTPPTSFSMARKHAWGIGDTAIDYLSHLFQQILANMRRGHFASVIISAFIWLFKIIGMLFWPPWRALPTLFLIVIAIRRWRRKSANPQRKTEVAPELQEIRQEFERCERQLSKKLSMPRRHSQTISEWLDSCSRSSIPLPESFVLMVRDYQTLRFRHMKPSAREILAFRKKCQKLRESFKEL